MFSDPIKHVLRVCFERLQKHSTKSVSLWPQSSGSNCERRMLACKKNELCLIGILYIKITNEECFIKV